MEGSAGLVSVLDAVVLGDAARALSGGWTPGDGSEPQRDGRLVAAARLVLYSAKRGLRLAATPEVLASVDADPWLRATVEDLDALGGGPDAAEVDALASIYEDDTLAADDALQLARCILDDRVSCLVVHAKALLRHSRDFDLPQRLLLLEPEEAVDQLDLATGEPVPDLPPGLTGTSPQWWLPG